jgi:hypothetical protein
LAAATGIGRQYQAAHLPGGAEVGKVVAEAQQLEKAMPAAAKPPPPAESKK